MTTEQDLIARIAERAGSGDALIGIGDDAAVIDPDPGRRPVLTTDTLVDGVHFDHRWSPSDLGHLALAVNLSDLAAMGAASRWALLSLTLPEGDADWLDAFLDGFLPLARSTDTSLIGGNIARGPLSITVQLIGEVDPRQVARRLPGAEGDLVVVSGTVGDAAAALALGESAGPELKARLLRPTPRLGLGQALAKPARSMLDLSDGLAGDLSRLLRSDGPGVEIELTSLPASGALCAAVTDAERRWQYQLGGGSDYELCALVAAERAGELNGLIESESCRLTVIGRITGAPGIRWRRPDGSLLGCEQARGWQHFSQGDQHG